MDIEWEFWICAILYSVYQLNFISSKTEKETIFVSKTLKFSVE